MKKSILVLVLLCVWLFSLPARAELDLSAVGFAIEGVSGDPEVGPSKPAVYTIDPRILNQRHEQIAKAIEELLREEKQ